MAHERIFSTEPAASLIISWDDESGTVCLGMEWDDPGTGETNTPEPAADGPQETNGATDGTTDGVVERRVEYGPGGRVEVPVEAYELRPYYNEAEQRWSIYLRMDRPRLNRIITTVRRARNKAFGQDE